MNLSRTLAAPLLLLAPVLLTPILLAQQPGPQDYPPPAQGQGNPGMYGQSGDPGERQRMSYEREQMHDEREDLGELGLPEGTFWLNPELAARIRISPDQAHRLSDTYLQGRLKIIQLEANEEMEEAKLDALESSPAMDNTEALAATDRLADARADTEKADAHLAFALRAILNSDQLTALRNGYMHAHMGTGRAPIQRQHPGGQPAPHPPTNQPAPPPA